MAVAYIVGQSPQSGGIIESKVEGRLASSLRYLNLAAVVIRSASSNRVAIKIGAGLKVKFIAAEKLLATTYVNQTPCFEAMKAEILL